MKTVTVSLGDRSYPIHIEAGLLPRLLETWMGASA